MKRNIQSIGNTMLSIISSTVVVLPFMIFLKWGSSHTVVAVLPFVIFYTFRTTGIFFIRGIRTKINSYILLKLAIYCGLLGSLFGLVGVSFLELELVSGLFLGLSAAWLPMANNTINYYKFENHLTDSKNMGITVLSLTFLGIVLLLPNNYSFVLFFVIYGLMYSLALSSLINIKNYEVQVHDLEDYSYRYLILFLFLFALVFLLRSSRLLLSTLQFDYFVYGTFLLVLCTLILSMFSHHRPQRRVPSDLSYLTILNGALGNYLFLFSSLYAAGYYGHNQLFARFYLPYVLGIVIAPIIGGLVGKESKKNSLIGMTVGLILVLITPFFTSSVLILSTFKSVFNGWLTEIYRHQDELPKDKRIWVKYTIQSMGSIAHQFVLMIIGSLLVMGNQSSVKTFFVMTSQKIPTVESRTLMTNWNGIATGILLIGLIVYGLGSAIKINVK